MFFPSSFKARYALGGSVVLLAVALAACGGGGGGGGGSAAVPATTPSSTVTVQGQVLDANWSDTLMAPQPGGSPLAGATVALSTTLATGSTPPPGAVTTTTSATGQFSMVWPFSTSGSTPYLYVFPTDSHAAIHMQFGSANLLGALSATALTLQSMMPTADDLAWLAQMNANRATAQSYPATTDGISSNGVALAFDSSLLMAARFWADYQAANGFYAHCLTSPQVSGENCPGQASAQPLVNTWMAQPVTRETHFGGLGVGSENLGGSTSLTPTMPGITSIGAQIDNGFFYEAAGYSQGGYVIVGAGGAQNCSISNCGHYENLIRSTNRWAGVGVAAGQKTGPGVGTVGSAIGVEDY